MVDFIYIIWVLGSIIGVLLIDWGLWGDRSKGRPRCPKCWYDMRGTVPRLVCPECGHDALQEEQLYLRRPRPELVRAGVFLLILPPLLLFLTWFLEALFS